LRACGLSFHDDCLRPLAIPHAHSEEKAVLAVSDGAGGVAIRPVERRAGWPEDWSEEVVESFRSTTVKLMSVLGYELA
jgi:hypothetical protein